MSEESYALEACNIYKSFQQNEVLHGVNFRLKKGEIHGLVGGNGAGKSTLMKIINGVYRMDSGELRINGKKVSINSALEARHSGIAMVYQEFSLVPSMTIMDNLFLANEPKRCGLIRKKLMYAKTKEAMQRLHIEIDPKALVEEISVGNKQMLEITKAMINEDAGILILDEPTASLSRQEIDVLFNLMREMKRQGVSIILVSHHLQEIMEVCDRVTVLRGGYDVMEQETADIDLEAIVAEIVGHKVEEQKYVASGVCRSEKPMMEVSNLKWKKMINDVSFSVYGGEILGIAGMMGSGRTEILNMLYGLVKPDSGNIKLAGKAIKLNHPATAIKYGIGMVPEDRATHGVIAGHSVRMNVLLPIWRRISKAGIISDKKGKEITRKLVNDLNIKTTDIDQCVGDLSGGNQQKVVFAKSIVSNPKVYLLDDPTVGVDVEFKNSICREIRKISDQGNAVILVTGELDEMAKIADRILILSKGKVMREISRNSGEEITEKSLLMACQSIDEIL